MRFIHCLFLVAFAILSTESFAQTSTFNSVSDATLIEDGAGSRASGSGDAIFVGRTQRDGFRRGLIRFDVSTIPANSVIQSATLRLYLLRSRPEELLLELHRATNSWDEGTSSSFGGQGAPAASGDATWLHRFYGTSQFWTTPGGDFAPSVSASEIIEAPEGVFHQINGVGLATDIQSWVNQPASNFGWALTSEISSSAKAYASRENTNISFRPQLIVNWTPPVVVSESGDVPIPIWVLVMFGAALFYNANRFRQ